MEGEDLSDFEELLDPECKVGASRISAALAQLGYMIGSTLIGEHRNRLCRCYKVPSNG